MAMDALFNVPFSAPVSTYTPELGYWVGQIAEVPAASILSIAIFGGPGTSGTGSFGFLPDTGGGSGNSGNPPTKPRPQPTPAPTQPTKPPCNHVGSGQGDINFGRSRAGVGPTVGAQITANKVHLYGGMQVGIGLPPQGSASLTVRNGTDISPGLNYSVGAGSVVGFSYSGKLNLTSLRVIGSSLRNGTFSFGGTTPGVGASVTYVSRGWQIPCL